MAMITYDNKSTLNPQPSVADVNKVTSGDMNEIKSVVNTNYGEVGDITTLTTTNKTSVVSAVNELKGGETYSTTQEIDTGKTLDGKKIYRSYIDFAHPSTGSFTYNHNLGIGEVVSINGYCTISGQTVSSHGYRPFPQIDTSTGYMFLINNITENSITTKATGWQNNHIYIWLEYTKSS